MQELKIGLVENVGTSQTIRGASPSLCPNPGYAMITNGDEKP